MSGPVRTSRWRRLRWRMRWRTVATGPMVSVRPGTRATPPFSELDIRTDDVVAADHERYVIFRRRRWLR